MTMETTTIGRRALPASGTGVGGMARTLAAVVAGSILLALSARIQVPMWPVPMTMQTLAVLAIGMVLGARLGAATVGLYLLEGAAGMPVFAGGGGLAYLAGPTGGFLLGFLPSAALVGWLADRGVTRTMAGSFLAALPGLAAVYVLGAGWLAFWVGAENAIAGGVLPFLPGDLIKAALVALVLPAACRMLSGAR